MVKQQKDHLFTKAPGESSGALDGSTDSQIFSVSQSRCLSNRLRYLMKDNRFQTENDKASFPNLSLRN